MKCEDVFDVIGDVVQIVLYTCTGRVIKSGHKAELIHYGSWFVHGIYPHDSNFIFNFVGISCVPNKRV